MKIDLPLETWVACFESLSRKQLAALLPHLGDEHEETKNRPIADRQFVKNVQFYLHEWGNVTLGWIYIQSSSKGPVFVNKAGQELLLAKVPPMPSNIKSFKEITINYYDQSVLDFLQEFRLNSLLTNVNLSFSIYDEKWRKMMNQLLPSITSIESLEVYYCYEHNTALFQEHSDLMTSARVLDGCDFGYGSDDWYRHWLHISRDDGKPRILVADDDKVNRSSENGINPILPFIENIKKDFLDANQAVSFFAGMGKHEDANVQSILLANDKTQEKLVINAKDIFLGGFVTISRYPMGAHEEYFQEVRKFVIGRWFRYQYQEKQERKIRVQLKNKSGCFCSLI